MSALEPLAADRLVAQLQLERRDDGDQVRVAAALAVAVHRALHQPGAGLHGHERVRHAAAGVVVGVDAHLHRVAELGDHARRRRAHLGGKRRAVRVAQRHVLGARLGGGAQAAQRVVRVVAEGVEEVLGVVDHPLALPGQEAHGVGDHPQVLLGIHLRDLLEVERPRLPDQRADRGEAVGKDLQPLIVLSGSIAAPRHAEGGDGRPSEALLRQELEERFLLRIGGGEAGLDVGECLGRRERERRGSSRRPRGTSPLPAFRRAALCHRQGSRL